MTDLVLNWDLGTGGLLVVAALAIALLLVLIMAFKVHAFLALMVTSLLTAIAAGIPYNRLVESLGSGSTRRSAASCCSSRSARCSAA